MAKAEANSTKRTLEVVSNSKGLMKDIVDSALKYNELEIERKALNDKMGAIRSDLEAKGIDKDAFKVVRSVYKKDPQKRASFKNSMAICYDAFEDQKDLFDQKD